MVGAVDDRHLDVGAPKRLGGEQAAEPTPTITTRCGARRGGEKRRSRASDALQSRGAGGEATSHDVRYWAHNHVDRTTTAATLVALAQAGKIQMLVEHSRSSAPARHTPPQGPDPGARGGGPDEAGKQALGREHMADPTERVWPAHSGCPVRAIVGGGGRRGHCNDDVRDSLASAPHRRAALLERARRASRADANLASLLELALDKTAAAELDQRHRRSRLARSSSPVPAKP